MAIRPALAMLLSPLLALGLLGLSLPAAAAAPGAFTARYDVSQDGMPMGVATVTLRRAGNGEWIFSKDIKGTGGLAALLGASVQETSRFRWEGDTPQAISYDYRMQAAGKRKQRHMTVDWRTRQVSMDEGKGVQTYPSAPGLVDRNTAALALGVALHDGKRNITLPMAVRQTVQLQQYSVTGKQPVTVKAGTFSAERVERADAERDFSAWYVPSRYPVPVKLAQRGGGNLVMELVSYQAQ